MSRLCLFRLMSTSLMYHFPSLVGETPDYCSDDCSLNLICSQSTALNHVFLLTYLPHTLFISPTVCPPSFIFYHRYYYYYHYYYSLVLVSGQGCLCSPTNSVICWTSSLEITTSPLFRNKGILRSHAQRQRLRGACEGQFHTNLPLLFA